MLTAPRKPAGSKSSKGHRPNGAPPHDTDEIAAAYTGKATKYAIMREAEAGVRASGPEVLFGQGGRMKNRRKSMQIIMTVITIILLVSMILSIVVTLR
jgi:hypothetical protein